MARDIQQQIETSIHAFVQELSTLVKAATVESVSQALGGEGAPAKARRGRPPGSKNASARAMVPVRPPRRGKRAKRSSEQVDAMAARVLEHVKKNSGTSVERMSKVFKVKSKELMLPIRKLISEKKLKTSGQRRGTKYHAR
jgi:hypothetical protein